LHMYATTKRSDINRMCTYDDPHRQMFFRGERPTQAVNGPAIFHR
jgi:hypothetical protein